MRHATATNEQPEWEQRKTELKARAVASGYRPYVHHGEMLTCLDEVASAERERLHEIEQNAAYWYTASSLWPKLPSDVLGDRTDHAMEIRRQTAEIAETLWLAASIALNKAIHG